MEEYMKKFHNILFATDLTEQNYKIATSAADIAKQNNSQLHLIHALDTLPICAWGYGGIQMVEKTLEEEAKKRLFALGKQLGVAEQNIYLKNQPSKIAIIELAKEIKSDLIIVGSHSQHSIFGSLGSTANGVVNNAMCDVLVLKQG